MFYNIVLAIKNTFAVVSIHQSALGLRGELWPFLLIHNGGLCPSGGDINTLMMMKITADGQVVSLLPSERSQSCVWVRFQEKFLTNDSLDLMKPRLLGHSCVLGHCFNAVTLPYLLLIRSCDCNTVIATQSIIRLKPEH
jgi:hypothetical protein